MSGPSHVARRHARIHGKAGAVQPGDDHVKVVRVAIYERISTDEEHQPFSLEAQDHRLLAFIPTQPGWVHVATYQDQMSGAKASRPDLDRAMRDAALGKFDVLLVYRVDRFARSLKVLVHLLEDLEAVGVAFRSATEPIDTSTATGRMLVQLLGVFAEFERATIIDRVVNGMERKAARGGWPGGTRPHGLTVGEDNLLTTTEDFPIIERIFARYDTATVGSVAIAAELNDDGLRNRNGRRWTPQVILGILRNRAYVGEVFFRGTWYRSSPVPFIAPEVFDRVQALLDERGEGYAKRFNVRHPEYLLTGRIRCGKCGRRYVGVSAHGKRHRYRYYMCWTRSRYGRTECDAERLRADELEAAVFDSLVAVYSDPDLLREAAEADRHGAEDDAGRVEADLALVQAELRKTEAAIHRYMAAFEDGKLTGDLFSARVDNLTAKAKTLRARQAELEEEASQQQAAGVEWVLTDEAAAAIRADLTTASGHAPDVVRKSLAQAFVHELRVEDRYLVQPTFRVLPGVPDNLEGLAGPATGPAATGVRTMTSVVEVAGIEPASFGFSTGLLRAHPVEGSRASHRHRHRCEAPVS